MPHPLRSVGRAVAVIALVLAAIAIVLPLVAGAVPGPLALFAVLAAHVLLACIALALVAVSLARDRVVLVAAVLTVGLVFARVGAEWLSLPVPPAGSGETRIEVLSWNLEVASGSAGVAPDVLIEHGAQIVALQELTPEAAAALERDSRIVARYPYRVLHPDPGVLGMGILSTAPITTDRADVEPPMLAATVELPGGPVHVLDVHPLPGRITTLGASRLPIGFDPTLRDRALGSVRVRIDELLATGGPVIVLGDLNVSPTEPGASLVTGGLRDTHAEAGLGPGWTWRPSRFEGTSLALLRIDYILLSREVRPVSTSVDCRWPGDHCVVTATLGLTAPE